MTVRASASLRRAPRSSMRFLLCRSRAPTAGSHDHTTRHGERCEGAKSRVTGLKHGGCSAQSPERAKKRVRPPGSSRLCSHMTQSRGKLPARAPGDTARSPNDCQKEEGTMAALKLKPGIVTGAALDEVFAYCKEAQCALPAVNVIGSSTANAALEAARQAKAPIIIQYSHGGGQFNAGKQLDNKTHQ